MERLSRSVCNCHPLVLAGWVQGTIGLRTAVVDNGNDGSRLSSVILDCACHCALLAVGRLMSLAEQTSFGPGALTLIALYLASMVAVGWLGRMRRHSDTMADFYLASRTFGVGVLFLTLYATQYSGNTLFGYTGVTYRIGLEWTVSVLFMFSIVVGYLLFAPRLVELSRRYQFITPGDFITHRFKSPVLTVLCTLLMVYALCNYTLAQLKAIGVAVEGITNGAVPGAYGIIGLAAIMVVYETLGGMRSVAWTDLIQGTILLVGFVVLLCFIPGLAGGLTAVVELISQEQPAKVQVPPLKSCVTWVSYTILVGGGAAIYPQAIQRLYASRSTRALKRSLTIMAFMPLGNTLIALICGLTAIVLFPELPKATSDQVLGRLCAVLMSQSEFGYWIVVIISAAILAALMSTADSALLSISSMITKDIYQVHIRPDCSQAEYTRVGKISSWVLISILVLIAIGTDKSLVRLLELKFEMLIQISPLFFLGLYWRRLDSTTTTVGLVCGLAIAMTLTFTGHGRIMGIHAGVVGLAMNLLICTVGAGWNRYVIAPSMERHYA